MQVSHIFAASAVPYNCDSARPVRGASMPGRGNGTMSTPQTGPNGAPALGRTRRRAHGYRDHQVVQRRQRLGFITPDDESGDVFVHYSNIIGQSGRRTLLEGEKVEYEAIEGPKGLQAVNVARAE